MLKKHDVWIPIQDLSEITYFLESMEPNTITSYYILAYFCFKNMKFGHQLKGSWRLNPVLKESEPKHHQIALYTGFIICDICCLLLSISWIVLVLSAIYSRLAGLWTKINFQWGGVGWVDINQTSWSWAESI